MASVEAVALPAAMQPEDLNGWIADAAMRAALQTDQAFVALDELEGLMTQSAPALVRLAALDGAPFLAVVGCRGKFVRALGPDLAIHQVRVTTITATVPRPFEARVEGAIDQVLSRMSLAGRSRSRARVAMIADRLKPVRFRGCWLFAARRC
jgi:hypothetical protein